MKVKKISLAGSPSAPSKEAQTNASFIPQTAAQFVTGVLGAPGNLIQGIGQGKPRAILGELPTTQQLRETAEEYFGTGQGYLKPEGLVQETLDLTAQALPFTLLLGPGSLASKTIADLGSSLVQTLGKKAGITNPLVLFGLGVLGSKYSAKAFNKLTGGAPAQYLTDLAKTAQINLEQEAVKLGTPISGNANKYATRLLELEDKISDTTSLKSTDKKELKEKIALYFNDIQNDKVNAAKLLERKREVNDLWPQYAGRENQAPRRFLDQIQKAIFEQADEIGKESVQGKKWNETFRASDSITKAMNYRSTLTKLMEEVPYIGTKLKSGLAQSVVGLLGGGYTAGLPGAALGAGAGLAGSKVLQKGEQIFGFLSKSPITRSLLNQAIVQSANRQIPQLAKTFTQLNKEAEKYEKKHPISTSALKIKKIS